MADQRATILVVDDKQTNLDFMADYLTRQGHRVVEARSGGQALAVVTDQPPDLILLDYMMPGMTGFEVLQVLKANAQWRHIPVIVFSSLEDLDSIARCIELGAEDYLPKLFQPALLQARIDASLEKKRLREREQAQLVQLEQAKQRADKLLNIVIPIGIALSVAPDYDALLERIVIEAKRLCHADAATLYLATDDQRLSFAIVQTDSLSMAMGGTTGVSIPLPPVPLYDPTTGAANHHNVVTHAVLSGETVNIPDAYQTESYDFSGVRAFDARLGYRSVSFLTAPLKNRLGRTLGALQLINAQDPRTGAIIPFDQGHQEMVEALSTLAVVALEAYLREQGLRQQVKQLTIEIDEARQAKQVAEITETDYFQQLQAKARRLRDRR